MLLRTACTRKDYRSQKHVMAAMLLLQVSCTDTDGRACSLCGVALSNSPYAATWQLPSRKGRATEISCTVLFCFFSPFWCQCLNGVPLNSLKVHGAPRITCMQMLPGRRPVRASLLQTVIHIAMLLVSGSIQS